jgi:epoxyqueuosine reductase QueG
MSDDELRRAMRGSAIRRTKVSGVRRNLSVALENLRALE